ncbi:MAG TPA: MFS transporter [Acidimicrobiales bacterium]|nr:MFS transporter [Acidimicrobiales bacterium]
MSTDVEVAATAVESRLAIYDRYLTSYPETAERTYYLAVTVLATVALYYEAYCGGTVAPQILNYYGITIKFYLFTAVIGFVLGAVATVLGGLADRVGRVNLVAYGLLAVGFMKAFVEPHMPNKWLFAAAGSLIGLVEGVILVATPALMRDFSPRMGRATAMGFWAVGPVLGSLCAAEVSSHTLNHLKAWQDQFTIAGIAGLGVGIVVLYTLRELHPALRQQIMVSLDDRALVEARAKGIDTAVSIQHPWKQMVTGRIVSSAFAIAVFLMFYYILVGALAIFLETTYQYSGSKANSVANWVWVSNAVGLVVWGLVSDRLRIRKPFMLVGGVGSLLATVAFLLQATRPHTTALTLTVILSIQGVFGAMVFGPWMAGFTETVEDRNPALMATGLAVSGGVLRVVVAVTIFLFPFVVPAVTPLVDYGPQVKQYATQYPAETHTAQVIHPATLQRLQSHPTDPAAISAAVAQIQAADHVTAQVALSRLIALGQAAPKLAYLQKHAPTVINALKQNPRQWQHWFLVTAAGQVIFLPLVFLMVGPWTPAEGRRRDEEQEELLQR